MSIDGRIKRHVRIAPVQGTLDVGTQSFMLRHRTSFFHSGIREHAECYRGEILQDVRPVWGAFARAPGRGTRGPGATTRAPYSRRNANTGSTAEARRAGKKIAAIATHMSTAGTAAKVSGSIAFSP